jgi:hypothetical protein
MGASTGLSMAATASPPPSLPPPSGGSPRSALDGELPWPANATAPRGAVPKAPLTPVTRTAPPAPLANQARARCSHAPRQEPSPGADGLLWHLPWGRGSLALGRGLVVLPLLALLLAGCLPWSRRSAGPPPGLRGNREDPALSGDGRLLASVVDRGGRATLLLQEQPSGRLVPLPQLGRLQPHRSPSLSWNGRYVALLVQEGDRSLPVLLDRLTGQLRRLLTPPGFQPQRLSLSPDGQRLALQLLQQGRSQVQVFDLSGLLEPDRPPGQPLGGGGPP